MRVPFLLLVAVLTGCRGCDAPDPAEADLGTSDVGMVVMMHDETTGSPPEGPVQATLRAIGPRNLVPRHVLIQIDRDVFDTDAIGQEPSDFAFAIEPPVDGSLKITGTRLVEFTPTDGFAPGASYRATLTGMDVGGETIQADEPWSVDITTPPFGLTRARLRSRERSHALVELQFSADVDMDEVVQRLNISVGEQQARPRETRQSAPHLVQFTIPVGLPHHEPEPIQIALDRGVPYAADPSVRAPAASEDIVLPKGPGMRIEHMSLREGANGFYLEVVCSDDAAGGERYWYDNREYNSYWVSERCMLDESMVDTVVRTDPPTALSVAAGPAGFRIFGAFARGPLKIGIDAGTPTVDGAVTYESKDKSFEVPARSARVNFASKGRYLPRSSWKNLGVKHMNIDALDLEVRHVPRENLVFWLTGTEPATSRTSNLVLDTDVSVRNPEDEMTTSWLPVQDLLPDPKPGIYEIKLSTKHQTEAARLMLTDLHLVAKASKRQPGDQYLPGIQVWALNVHDGQPEAGVTVKLVRSSGKSMGQCVTEGDSGCEIRPEQEDVDPSKPVALVATRAEDLTYIKLSDLKLDTPDDTSGLSYTSVLPYQAPLYTDRGVYRPGETAHVTAVVRTEDFVAPPAGLPTVVKLFDPRGREIRRRAVETNAGGMVAVDFDFGDYAITGRYRASAEIADQTAGQVSFQIEEFVPERLKVTASALESGFQRGTPVPVEVTGDWLFGGAASDAKVELQCQLESSTFAPDGLDGFHFGPAHLSGLPQPITLGTVEGTLDENGRVVMACPPSEGGASMGPARVVAQAAVFEGESGRTTVATATAPVHPSRQYIGLDTPSEKAEQGQVFAVQGRIVDWEGRKATSDEEISIEVYRMEEEYSWWWDEEGSSQQRQLRAARETESTVTADAKGYFTLDITPQIDSAGTLVRARSGDAMTELFVPGTGRRYWWGDSRQSVDSTPRPMRPAALAIDVPPQIKVGESASVTAVAPYAGRILFTVETDQLIASEWRDAQAGENAWQFSVDTFTPNVYVSAFLVKNPHLESQTAFLPDRAFGVKSVPVAPEAFEQAVTLSVPDEVRPFSPLEVTVDVGKGQGPTFATVAVVDEGILSLTQFEDPDPLGEIFAQRALGVSTFETVGWTLLMEPAGPSSATGGDGGEVSSRVQMVKPVALWSGVVQADTNGRATVEFDIPGYRGKVRVMAVTANATRVGHASAQVVVRDPLVLQTTLPRFLITGDEAEIPVMVSNQSGAPQRVTVKLEATELQTGATPDVTDGSPPVPILTFLGGREGTLELAEGEAKTAVFRVKTRDLPGAAHFLVTAEAGALRSKEALDLPIQVAATEITEIQRVSLKEGTVDLTDRFDGWMPGSDRSTLWVTANPYAHAMTHLRYLVRYPYG